MSEVPDIVCRSMSARYGEVLALREISLSIPQGGFVGLIGPNGAGKTSLLRAISGELRPCEGELLVDGRAPSIIPPRERARLLSYVPPSLEVTPPDFTVHEFVALGRTPYLGGWRAPSAQDRAAVARALAMTDMEKLGDRSLHALSEGERHRAMLALGLAQEPRVLLLDEPTAHLDIKHAWTVMELIHELHAQVGLTILITTHDLNIAAGFCASLYLLESGRIAAHGTPREVLRDEMLSRVYDYPIQVLRPDTDETVVGVVPRRRS